MAPELLKEEASQIMETFRAQQEIAAKARANDLKLRRKALEDRLQHRKKHHEVDLPHHSSLIKCSLESKSLPLTPLLS